MKILVFDIDGTLAETNQVDEALYLMAVRAALPGVSLESFETFSEMTDTAILRDICAVQECSDFEAVRAAVLDHFMAGLRQALDADSRAFAAVPGAPTVFDVVRRAGWTPAIATGGWRPSAKLKLKAASIPTSGVPLATSSESERRVDIIQLAVSDAADGITPDQIVYVGDGSWDVKACRELGIGFIGRGREEAEDALRSLGARHVLPDFADPETLLGSLSSDDLTPIEL